MPIRIPMQTILVTRDGERVVPPIGKPFDFTAKEIEEINAVNPRAIRKPVQEVEAPVAEQPPAKASGKAAKAAAPNPDGNDGKDDGQL